MKSNFYIPAKEIDPWMMAQNINSLRAKEREREARIKELEGKLKSLEMDFDRLKEKLNISTL